MSWEFYVWICRQQEETGTKPGLSFWDLKDSQQRHTLSRKATSPPTRPLLSILPVSLSLWGHLFKNYHSSVVTSVLNVAGLVWEHRVWGCGSASPVHDQLLASNYLHNGTNDTRHPRKKWILGKGIWSSGCLRTLLPHWPICFPYGIINSLT